MTQTNEQALHTFKLSAERIAFLETLTVKLVGGAANVDTWFSVESNEQLTDRELSFLQYRAGYHPCGYGGPLHVSYRYHAGHSRHYYTWTCYSHCD